VSLRNICRANKKEIISDLDLAKKIVNFNDLGYIELDKNIEKLLKKHDVRLNINEMNENMRYRIIDKNINNLDIYGLIVRSND
jgi:hypothetical protein